MLVLSSSHLLSRYLQKGRRKLFELGPVPLPGCLLISPVHPWPSCPGAARRQPSTAPWLLGNVLDAGPRSELVSLCGRRARNENPQVIGVCLAGEEDLRSKCREFVLSDVGEVCGEVTALWASSLRERELLFCSE